MIGPNKLMRAADEGQVLLTDVVHPLSSRRPIRASESHRNCKSYSKCELASFSNWKLNPNRAALGPRVSLLNPSVQRVSRISSAIGASSLFKSLGAEWRRIMTLTPTGRG